ncbi:ABC transporter permease [Acidicapsa acidisoli]|uniref:ABC transporter permease n=1 Tax=Acidicapsa acidisoli TaxID=1615681 RepID=UPI0021DF5F4D|nr:ABC transporter permease [Acidicapsa acidisoli]
MIWLRQLLSRRRRYDELAEMIQEHLEEKIADLIDRGMTREQAEFAARREFGNVTRIEERSREIWQWPNLESTLADIRFAMRQLVKSPGFTITALLTLALGIGVNVAVFSVINAVLLSPLPYKNADRLVMIAEQSPKEPVPAFDTYREYEEWIRNSHSFEKLAGATWARNAGAVFSWRGEKKEVMAVPATVAFFSMLGVDAVQGRTFASQDLNSACTVVLSHSFWEERLGGEPSWIGKSLTLDDQPCMIVGVMPRNFSFYPKQTELWTLITPNSKFTQKPWDMPILAFGILKPGVGRPAAQEELASIQRRVITENPSWAAMNLEPVLEDLQSEFTWLTGRNLRQGLLILFAVVGIVLLIACVNVANLLLGRATVRQRELGVRAALGAGRSRLIRQLLTESVVLSFFGACLGVLFAVLSVRYITTKGVMELPPGNPISVNWEVLAFTFLLALMTGALFGVMPAWKASRLDLNEVLKQSGRTTSHSTFTHRTSRNLVVIEVALSLIVLVAAGLLIQSLLRLKNAPLGYERDHLLTADLRLPATSYAKPEDTLSFWDNLESKLVSLPGIQGVAFAPALSFEQGMGPVTVEGAGSRSHVASASDPESISCAYFRVAGIPLLQGREFSADDRAKSVPVAIVDETFARQFLPKGAELGQRIKLGKLDSKEPWLTIVGIVGNVSRPTLFEGYSQRPSLYRPLRQAPDGSLSIFARTTGNPRAVEPEIGHAVEAVDGNVPVPTVQTVDEAFSWFTSEPRLRAELFGLFSVLALILAAVGIYGVLSQRVAQRTQEIGIRVALGANHQDVLRLVLGEGLKVILAGILIGVMGALALTRLLSSMLYGIETTDPLTFGSVSFLLSVVALVACYVPARRAMRLNPLIALRCE